MKRILISSAILVVSWMFLSEFVFPVERTVHMYVLGKSFAANSNGDKFVLLVDTGEGQDLVKVDRNTYLDAWQGQEYDFVCYYGGISDKRYKCEL